MNKKTKTIISTVLVMAIVLVTLGVSYAYFTAGLTGGESASTIVVTGGKMEIAFAGGSNIKLDSIYPQADAVGSKSFSLRGTNNTALGMYYNLKLVVEFNSFSSGVLTYSLKGGNPDPDGALAPNKTNQSINKGASTIVLGTGHFGKTTTDAEPTKSVLHSYILELFFPDTGVPQNGEQNQSISAHVEIEPIKTP